MRSISTTDCPTASTSYTGRSLPSPPQLRARRRRCAVAPCRAVAVPQKAEDPFAKMEEYNDGLLNKFFIKYFSQKMSDTLGGRPYEEGYDGFVQLSREIMKGRSSKQQREAVGGVLDSLMPPEAQQSFRTLFPLSKWSAEINARITVAFFGWLVGPMELQHDDITFKGRQERWRSKVQIKKCRYLEQSGCVGMCVNMCKVPTQQFFTDRVGLPLTMNPNFEDLSCEMLFGKPPPPLEEDEAFMQPCFPHVCNIGNRDAQKPCPKIDTSRPQPKR
ncbi:hypothetical protein WJX73_007876 [Symbiochloris irregularis]|uniref:Beta-carotene isomerase D27-like C-terminal domain-containing protein n=1 Tax=Symbiochloris irregularis TaxID=706552 RepID=A0AAW1NLJ8_9CHLO